MRTEHHCEICGFHSSDEDTVRKCESLGSYKKYAPGMSVKFVHDCQIPYINLIGKIEQLRFHRETHEVSYEIVVDQENNPGLRLGGKKLKLWVPEKRVLFDIITTTEKEQ